MSYNYNQCTLMGRLTKDPEFKQVTENFCKLSFTLAITRRYQPSHKGNKETDFIPVSLIGSNAAIASKFLKKGSPVLVWGIIQVRNYEKDNERKWITEVIGENFQFLGNRQKEESALAEKESIHS